MTDTATDTKTEIGIDFPSLWGVKFLNDDYTPMDFVVAVLMEYFKLSLDGATQIMVDVHEKGEAVVGAYPKDIAETKAALSEGQARKAGHPLRLHAVPV